MAFVNIIEKWFNKYFPDHDAVLLVVLLTVGFGLVIFLGGVFAPVIVSLVISYFLHWWVNVLVSNRVPSRFAYTLVYISFLALFASLILLLLPLVWRQLASLFGDLPNILQVTKQNLLKFINEHPAYFSEAQINNLMSSVLQEAQSFGKKALSVSISTIPGVIAWMVYLVLVPILVFFFLKDHKLIKSWLGKYLPKNNKLLKKVWLEMDAQIGNYIRGKITEIIIVGFFTYLVFLYFDLNYRVLLAFLVGLSVVIPYIGAVVVTFPVVLVGFLQWGISPDFAYMVIAYLVVQALDGNVLVPLLFSEAVNLHPVAIILAILLFGAMWGFWGVFFAIPLATLVKAVINSWPKKQARKIRA